MYSVLLTLSLTSAPVEVSAVRASAGCQGVQQVAAAGCQGYTARSFRAPVRRLLTAPFRAVHNRAGVTYYYPVTATYIAVPTPTQSVAPPAAPPKASSPAVFLAPPAFRTPVRSYLFCPNGRCPF